MRGLLLSTVFPASVLLSGCVTTQGGGLVGVSDSFLKPLGMDTSTVTDSFSAEMRAVRQSVEAGKLDEAEASVLKDLEFFKKRFADETKPLPSYMQTLGEHVWRKHYSQRTKTATEELSAIENVLEPINWARQSQSLQNAKRLDDALRQDAVVGLLRQGIDERQKLQQELQRVVELVKTSRPKAVALSHADVLASGKYSFEFPAEPFVAADYVADPEFQAAAQQELLRQPTPAALSKKAVGLSDFLSEQTRSAVDQQFAELVRRELLADSKVTLEEMTNLAGLRTPFNGANEKLTRVVRVGYVDLTSANLRNRSIFDFEVAFKQDLSLTFVPADETIFRSGDWSGYDYLFVTELAAAKVTRDFKSRAPVKSRAKVGERQEPNPGYVSAMTSYQQAMAEFQRAQISSAVPKACQGWGCVLQGLADGLAEGTARQRVDSASKALVNRPGIRGGWLV